MKKWYPKNVRTYCRTLLVLTFSIFLMSCVSWIMQTPTFALRGITLRPLSFTEMNILLDIEVLNPNRFDLTFQSFEYTIFLKNEEIGNGRLEKELLVPSSSTTRIQVPVVARFKDFSGSLKAILTQADLPYKIEGKVAVRTVFGNHQFLFSKEERLNSKN